MSITSYVVAALGILLGVAITLQINRLMYNHSHGPLPTSAEGGAVRHYANHSSNIPSIYKGNHINNVSHLIRKRDELRLSLREIEKQIEQTVNREASRPMEPKQPLPNPGTQRTVLSTSTCPYTFKVYVYEIPHEIDALRISLEARRNKSLHVCHKCILEQFSLEYIMNDYFHNFCGRTRNPQEADYFYLPLVRDAEFRHAMSISTRNRAPSSAEWALLNLLEKNDSTLWKSVFHITDAYWHAHGGADHIIAMPAPVTNIRHETSQRGFFHYMMHLHPPIFLCLEYSIGFVREYPICATQKNVVVPYPTTDPELFNGKLTSAKVERKYLLYYAGGLHGDCVEVRQAMKVLMRNSTKLANVIPPVRSNQAEREHGFLAATYCPIPIGDSPSSKRMYDVLNFGCIPVVLSDDLIWAFSDQSGGPLNHSDFSIQIPQSMVHYTARKTLARYKGDPKAMGILPASQRLIYDILQAAFALTGEYQAGTYVNPLVLILQNIPAVDVAHLQAGVQRAAPFYRYYSLQPTLQHIPLETHVFPDGGAMQVLMQQLQQRRDRGLEVIRQQCVAERQRKHNYIRNFACDGRDKVESLVRRRRLWSS